MEGRGHTHSAGSALWLVLATLCALPMLAAYAVMATTPLLNTLEVTGSAVGSAAMTAIYVPYLAGARWVLSQPAPYVLLSLAALLSALVSLIYAPQAWRRMLPPLALAALVVLFPLAYRYQPALAAAPGYEATVVTAPGWPGGGVIRAAMVALEERRCELQLTGWSGDALFYRETCGTEVRHWTLDLAVADVPWQVGALPSAWDHTVLGRERLLTYVRAVQVRSQSLEPVLRPLYLADEGLASHDGRWVALVSQQPEGPQDVLLLALEDGREALAQ